MKQGSSTVDLVGPSRYMIYITQHPSQHLGHHEEEWGKNQIRSEDLASPSRDLNLTCHIVDAHEWGSRRAGQIVAQLPSVGFIGLFTIHIFFITPY